MRLLLVRHAIAEDRAEFAATGQPDDLRPLTDRGRKRMREVARGLARLVPEVDVLATSPLSRAVETAEILARRVRAHGVDMLAELGPEAPPEDLGPWLVARASDDLVACVGHEPHLSSLASWLLAGDAAASLEMKKGGACLLDLSARPGPGRATLLWLLPPRVLRDLA
jgi:phosphohistidine phosphatase